MEYISWRLEPSLTPVWQSACTRKTSLNLIVINSLLLLGPRLKLKVFIKRQFTAFPLVETQTASLTKDLQILHTTIEAATASRIPLCGWVSKVLPGGRGDIVRWFGERSWWVLLPWQVECKLMIVNLSIPILVTSDVQQYEIHMKIATKKPWQILLCHQFLQFLIRYLHLHLFAHNTYILCTYTARSSRISYTAPWTVHTYCKCVAPENGHCMHSQVLVVFQECLSQIDIHGISGVQIPVSTDRKNVWESKLYWSIAYTWIPIIYVLEEVPLLQDFLESSNASLCLTVIYWTTPEQRTSPTHLAYASVRCRPLYVGMWGLTRGWVQSIPGWVHWACRQQAD